MSARIKIAAPTTFSGESRLVVKRIMFFYRLHIIINLPLSLEELSSMSKTYFPHPKKKVFFVFFVSTPSPPSPPLP